jgi:hypothetical protein
MEKTVPGFAMPQTSTYNLVGAVIEDTRSSNNVPEQPPCSLPDTPERSMTSEPNHTTSSDLHQAQDHARVQGIDTQFQAGMNEITTKYLSEVGKDRKNALLLLSWLFSQDYV